MVKSAASLSQGRRDAALLRWRVGLASFLITNALAYRTQHFWPCLGVTSLIMVCAFGFRGSDDDDAAFVTGANRLSAYSVFNEGFQELPGTLNAAGVDRQIRGGGTGADNDIDERSSGGVGSGHRWGKGHKLG